MTWSCWQPLPDVGGNTEGRFISHRLSCPLASELPRYKDTKEKAENLSFKGAACWHLVPGDWQWETGDDLCAVGSQAGEWKRASA